MPGMWQKSERFLMLQDASLMEVRKTIGGQEVIKSDKSLLPLAPLLMEHIYLFLQWPLSKNQQAK